MNPTVSMPWNRWMKAGAWLALAALILGLVILADTVRHAPRILADDQLAACFGGQLNECDCGAPRACPGEYPPNGAGCSWCNSPLSCNGSYGCNGCPPITTTAYDTYQPCVYVNTGRLCCNDTRCENKNCDPCKTITIYSRNTCFEISDVNECNATFCCYQVPGV